jgi:uncharacterized membrane protein YfcA
MQRGLVLPMAGAAAAATPLGVAAVLWLDAELVRHLVGLAVVGSGLLLLVGWRRQGPARLPGTLVVGAAGGVLNGLAGIGGPPAALWLLAGDGGAARDRAGLVVYVALTQAARAAVAACTGVLGREALLRATWLAYMVGTWGGATLFRSTPKRLFRVVAVSTVLALGTVAAGR